MEEITVLYPQHVNFRRMEDENTALHIAAANNRLEVLKHLCTIVSLINKTFQHAKAEIFSWEKHAFISLLLY